MGTIVQGPRPEDNFFMISNQIARDPKVTMRAARVYIFMRSHRDGWALSVSRVAKALELSKDTVSRALNELIELGYIDRAQSTDSGGKFESITYTVMSEPCPKKQDAVTTSGNDVNVQVKPRPTLPDTEKQDALEDYLLENKREEGVKVSDNPHSILENNPLPIFESSDSFNDHGHDSILCENHHGMNPDKVPPCRACQRKREAHEAQVRDSRELKRRARREAIKACSRCDENGLIVVEGVAHRCRCEGVS